jgi:hypothetical protein
MQLFFLEARINLIIKRINLPDPGLNDTIFPFLKLEKESAGYMIIVMMRFIIFKNKIQNIGKMGKTILIQKAGHVSDPGIRRSIKFSWVIQRIIFRGLYKS